MLAAPLMFMVLTVAQEAPRFTDEQVRQAVACANEAAGQCAPAEARSAAINCLATPRSMGVDAVDECLAAITDRCVARWAATTSEMNTRVILTCAAQSSAALREAADDWLERAEKVVPSSTMSQYRGLRSTVPARIETQSAGKDALGSSGTHTGVWASFVMFLWQQQWQHVGLAD